MSNETNGLLLAGDLLLAVRDAATGLYGGYERLQADKLEIKTPSEMSQKTSKGRETFGQAWLTFFAGKPAEFALTLDEVSRGVLAMQLAGEVSALTQTAGALTGIEVTVVPGKWVEIGYENLDITALVVKDAADVATYVNGTDYEVNPRLGMIYVPEAGAIPAGIVKLTAAKKAFTGAQIAGGKKFSSTLRLKLDGINLITREGLLLEAPQATVSAQDAFDFLSGKLATVPLKGQLQVVPGANSPFTIKYFG